MKDIKRRCMVCGKEIIFSNTRKERVTCSKKCSRIYNILGSKRKEILSKRRAKEI